MFFHFMPVSGSEILRNRFFGPGQDNQRSPNPEPEGDVPSTGEDLKSLGYII